MPATVLVAKFVGGSSSPFLYERNEGVNTHLWRYMVSRLMITSFVTWLCPGRSRRRPPWAWRNARRDCR